MKADFLALARKQYISVQGDSLRYKVHCQGPIPKGLTHIYVNWFLASTRHQTFSTGVWRKCSGENLTHSFCLKATANSRGNKTYIIMGNIRPYYDKNSLNNRQKISWNDASELCRRSGADLLSFLNRDDRLFPIYLQYFCFLYYISFIYSCIRKRLIPEPYGYIQVELGGLIDSDASGMGCSRQ